MLRTWWMLLKMFLTKANRTRTLHFCVNLKYETQNSISKCGAEPQKGENSKTWVGRISNYGLVPARTGNSSISWSFKNSCCVQECVKTTEDKTQNVFWWWKWKISCRIKWNNILVNLHNIQYRKHPQKFNEWLRVLLILTQGEQYNNTLLNVTPFGAVSL